MFEKSIFLYFYNKKTTYVVFSGKVVILVKCPIRHNTSPVRSKNWWDGRGEAIQPFRSV